MNMPRRRIVIFSALYMPHLGGVEKFSQSIAAELSKDSQVTVFCMNTENQPSVVKEGEVTIFFLPCFPLQEGRFPVPKPSALRIITEKLKEDRPDFAIVHGLCHATVSFPPAIRACSSFMSLRFQMALAISSTMPITSSPKIR